MKIKILIFLSIILLTTSTAVLNKCNVYADSSYEFKWYIVENDTYVRYGHIKITGNVNVAMVMLDNGTVQKFAPIIYSVNTASDVSLWYGGDHKGGDSLESAKTLGDYYNSTTSLDYITLEDANTGSILYLYDVWSPIIMESGPCPMTDFETSSAKYYYCESGADLTSKDIYINALNKLLVNGLGDFTFVDGSISRVSSYTLEPPLNVQVNNFQPKKMTITWEQSEDINIEGWYTEFYFQQTGNCKKTFFSSKKDFDTDFLKYTEILTHYKTLTVNSLDLSTTNDFLIEFIDNNGYEPQSVEIKKTNIMMRNVYNDQNGNTFYSNYVYLYQDENYKYIANEIDGSGVDGDGLTSNNIDKNVITDSELYNNAEINSIGTGSTSNGNAITVMRALLNELKQFPKFVYEFFAFLPDEIYAAISAFLLLLIPIALIKIVT